MRKGRGVPLRSELRTGMSCRTFVDDRPSVVKAACHGDPARCLWYEGRPMIVCARCLGFYIGLVVGLPWGVVMAYLGMSSVAVLLIFLLTSAPLAADGMTQYLGWRRSNNRLRLVTGLASGFGGGMGASYVSSSILGFF